MNYVSVIKDVLWPILKRPQFYVYDNKDFNLALLRKKERGKEKVRVAYHELHEEQLAQNM